ncbi:MAG: hypothetical protein KFH98_05995 [Gemmatimonadetes bacterium]|nr:hypothetical protein [Gemmatimonadota bacterium]
MRLNAALAAAVIATGFGAGGGDARAQSLRDDCTAYAAGALAYCESLADAAGTLPARLAIAAAGGNPVAGTASTLGMRMPGSPRWSIALRSTVAGASVPPIDGERGESPTLWSVNADGVVGLFNGFNLLPTIGGFGSVDVLASAGVVAVPEGRGFERSSPLTWALGARVGVLRESFTAPGVSVSAMYRSLPDVEFGDSAPGPYYLNSKQSVVSVRAAAGKRILGLGFTGGVGYDRVRGSIHGQGELPGTMTPNVVSIEESGVTWGRTSFFGNVSYTLLILNFAAELGWQESGERPADAHENTGKGGLFGGIAARLAI